SCCTVNVPANETPVTLNEADRAAPVFAPTWNATEPLPVPLVAPVSVSQSAPPATDHEHPAGTAILIVPPPLDAGTNWPPAFSEYIHAGATANVTGIVTGLFNADA